MSESEIKVTIHVSVGLTQEGLLRLTQGIGRPDLGVHTLNTILSQAGVDGGRFLGVSMDVDVNSITARA